MTIKVAVFDDVLAARREQFHIPGLDVGVFSHADDVCAICHGAGAPAVVCMDYAMGQAHASGEDAIGAVRAMGYGGHILAMSSDPAANAAMINAGADEALPKKAMLRSWLVALGAGQVKRRVTEGGFAALPLLALLGALGLFGLGSLLVGPWGHAARPADVVARVLAEGARPSRLDGAPVVLEATGQLAVEGQQLVTTAGNARLGAGELVVAANGARVTVVADAGTVWQVSDGPARRLAGARSVERSQRVCVGELLTVRGVADGPRLLATLITDEAHRQALGADMIARPGVQLGGLVVIGLGAVLLAAAPRG
jgi:hypothetical protein